MDDHISPTSIAGKPDRREGSTAACRRPGRQVPDRLQTGGRPRPRAGLAKFSIRFGSWLVLALVWGFGLPALQAGQSSDLALNAEGTAEHVTA